MKTKRRHRKTHKYNKKNKTRRNKMCRKMKGG